MIGLPVSQVSTAGMMDASGGVVTTPSTPEGLRHRPSGPVKMPVIAAWHCGEMLEWGGLIALIQREMVGLTQWQRQARREW